MELSKKAQDISSSITLAITAKAKKMKSEGIDVIGFGAGEPDFNTPTFIQDAAISAMKKGYTKYTPTSGINELKDAIINKFKNDNNLLYNRSQIIVGNGAKQCLANVFSAILNRGDEVIIPSPYWVSYPELVKLADGIPVFVNTNDDFSLNFDNLNRAVNYKTKAIVINSPNNPTGAVYSSDDLIKIANFAKENNLLIISDEIYEKLLYDGEKHISIASLSKDAFERTIVINGLSKSYAMTGWRIGYAAGDEQIIKLMTNIQSHTTSNINSITQYASVEGLNGPQNSVKEMALAFENRRNYMVDKINSIPLISCIKPKGAFYVMINIKKLIGKEVEGKKIKDSVDFSDLLLQKVKVAVIPGDGFGISTFVRLSYATSMDNIEEGLKRIEEFISKYFKE